MNNISTERYFREAALVDRQTMDDAIERMNHEGMTRIFATMRLNSKAARASDSVKANIFYGKEFNCDLGDEPIKPQPEEIETAIERMDIFKAKLIHYSMGISSEAGEIEEAVSAHVFEGKELDKQNIIEEIGDHYWYCARLLALIGSDPHEAMAMNNAKLKERYAKGYSNEAAIARADKTGGETQ